jgi:hypothetical protein
MNRKSAASNKRNYKINKLASVTDSPIVPPTQSLSLLNLTPIISPLLKRTRLHNRVGTASSFSKRCGLLLLPYRQEIGL